MKQIEKLIDIMRKLRDPDNGCDWDKEQTFQSISEYTLQEVYELLDAIERDDSNDIRDELGDLLFHVIFYAQIANEKGDFEFKDIVENVNEKIQRRHPHVFADTEINSGKELKQMWERIKAEERQLKENNSKGLLDDIGESMPAVMRAQKLQKRAAAVGFDWSDVLPVLDKIEEEFNELKDAISNRHDQDNISSELGDLLFACINLARHCDFDAEQALRLTNKKFTRRFQFIEEKLDEQGRSLQESSMSELDALWNEAKKKEHNK